MIVVLVPVGHSRGVGQQPGHIHKRAGQVVAALLQLLQAILRVVLLLAFKIRLLLGRLLLLLLLQFKLLLVLVSLFSSPAAL